jgi:CrcB protein
MPFDRRVLAAVFAGGFIGALARAGLIEALPPAPGEWPWATFVANLAGAFALGYFATRMPKRAHLMPFLGTGLCGALTTFSTMQLELLTMLDTHHTSLALAYAAVSLTCGFVAVAAATRLANNQVTAA